LETLQLDTRYHRRVLAELRKKPAFEAEYLRSGAAIDQIDQIVHQLDDRRKELGLSKAELARMVGKNPAQIRRLFAAGGNPEIRTISALTIAMGGRLAPSFKRTSKTDTAKERLAATG
jgi:DNA-binding phage protein